MTEKQKSDLSRAFSEDGAIKTHVGGQALLEGVMMRGKYNWAVAVREPDGGIYTEEHDLSSGTKKNSWVRKPLVRGCTALVESLALGFKALEIATAHAFNEEGETFASLAKRSRSAEAASAGADSSAAAKKEAPDQFSNAATGVNGASASAGREDFSQPLETAVGEDVAPVSSEKPSEGALGKAETTISMVLGLVLGVALFIVAPALITNLIVGEYDSNTVVWNIVDGVLRVAVFVFYIWLIGRMEDIKRMFMYHGAEHKTIHCYEHGLPLTPENARSFPRLHVRCGTAFLIMVMIIAILVYTIVPLNAIIAAWGVPDGAPKLVLVIAARIVLMPVIAGLSYEITVRWAGSHPDNPLVRVVLWPGMQMQYLTTNEPDDSQLECAIASMKLVLEREEAEEGAPAQVSAGARTGVCCEA